MNRVPEEWFGSTLSIFLSATDHVCLSNLLVALHMRPSCHASTPPAMIDHFLGFMASKRIEASIRAE